MKHFLTISLITVTFAGILAGGYFGYRRFLKDRERALSYRPVERTVTTTNGPRREARTYTEKELEEARKTGKLPKSVPQPATPNTAAQANDQAIQRTLRTLEEINRINEMNRRLQEQQQRQQRLNNQN